MNSGFILVLAMVLAAVAIALLFNLLTGRMTPKHTDAPEERSQ